MNSTRLSTWNAWLAVVGQVLDALLGLAVPVAVGVSIYRAVVGHSEFWLAVTALFTVAWWARGLRAEVSAMRKAVERQVSR